jgi:hypothetical protein
VFVAVPKGRCIKALIDLKFPKYFISPVDRYRTNKWFIDVRDNNRRGLNLRLCIKSQDGKTIIAKGAVVSITSLEQSEDDSQLAVVTENIDLQIWDLYRLSANYYSVNENKGNEHLISLGFFPSTWPVEKLLPRPKLNSKEIIDGFSTVMHTLLRADTSSKVVPCNTWQKTQYLCAIQKDTSTKLPTEYCLKADVVTQIEIEHWLAKTMPPKRCRGEH